MSFSALLAPNNYDLHCESITTSNGTLNNLEASAPLTVTSTGGVSTISLDDKQVAGTYTAATITVDTKGLITSAASGGVTSVSAGQNVVVSGSASLPQIAVAAQPIFTRVTSSVLASADPTQDSVTVDAAVVNLPDIVGQSATLADVTTKAIAHSLSIDITTPTTTIAGSTLNITAPSTKTIALEAGSLKFTGHATLLNYYDEGVGTFDASGVWATNPTGLIWTATRIGQVVTLYLQGYTGTCNTSASTHITTTAIDAAYRPSTPQWFLIRVRSNGDSFGTIYIDTTGIITIYNGPTTSSAFTTSAGQINGFYDSSFTYRR